jgi:glycine cleavage system aminomethyltransferase T
VGKHVLLSYLPPEYARVGQELAVEYMTERYPATVQCADSTPLFDPDNARVKAAGRAGEPVPA